MKNTQQNTVAGEHRLLRFALSSGVNEGEQKIERPDVTTEDAEVGAESLSGLVDEAGRELDALESEVRKDREQLRVLEQRKFEEMSSPTSTEVNNAASDRLLQVIEGVIPEDVPQLIADNILITVGLFPAEDGAQLVTYLKVGPITEKAAAFGVPNNPSASDVLGSDSVTVFEDNIAALFKDAALLTEDEMVIDSTSEEDSPVATENTDGTDTALGRAKQETQTVTADQIEPPKSAPRALSVADEKIAQRSLQLLEQLQNKDPATLEAMARMIRQKGPALLSVIQKFAESPDTTPEELKMLANGNVPPRLLQQVYELGESLGRAQPQKAVQALRQRLSGAPKEIATIPTAEIGGRNFTFAEAVVFLLQMLTQMLNKGAAAPSVLSSRKVPKRTESAASKRIDGELAGKSSDELRQGLIDLKKQKRSQLKESKKEAGKISDDMSDARKNHSDAEEALQTFKKESADKLSDPAVQKKLNELEAAVQEALEAKTELEKEYEKNKATIITLEEDIKAIIERQFIENGASVESYSDTEDFDASEDKTIQGLPMSITVGLRKELGITANEIQIEHAERMDDVSGLPYENRMPSVRLKSDTPGRAAEKEPGSYFVFSVNNRGTVEYYEYILPDNDDYYKNGINKDAFRTYQKVDSPEANYNPRSVAH